MQICRLCAKKHETQRENYNKSEEWENLVKNICGYLGQGLQNVHRETTWLCGSCHKQAKTTQSFMRLVEAGQRKLKRLLTLKEDAPEEQTLLVEAMENGETGIELDESVKRDTKAESSATIDWSDDYQAQTNLHLKKVLKHLMLKSTAQQSAAVNEALPDVNSPNKTTSQLTSQRKTPNKNAGRSLLKPRAATTPQTLKNSTSAEECGPAASTLKNSPQITRIDFLPTLDRTKSFTTSSFITLLKSQQQPAPVASHRPPAVYKFQCVHCLKYFKQSSTLKKHLRTHSGEKPYKCPLCPKSFADPSNFRRHKILHKNAADALLNATAKISLATLAKQARVQQSPTHSIASDPDPDGLELMQHVRGCTPSSISDDSSYSDWSNWSVYASVARTRQNFPALLPGIAAEDEDSLA